MPAEEPPERRLRAALSHLHDLPYLQTHPFGGRRGKELRRRLGDGLAELGAGRTAELMRLRYAEALTSAEVTARLGISRSEYYHQHARGLAALASLLADADTTGDAGRGLGDPSGPSALPGPSRRSGGVARLPRQLTSFVGREREVAGLSALAAVSPLVTLAGPGGVGKTRLALAVAEHRASESAWLVELAALADGALVPTAVAAALGVPVRSDPLQSLAGWLGGRPALLLLDNCEHLVGACAGLVEPLLRACPGLRVLATSREPLGVPGEVVHRVGPLPPEQAVRLFAERAGLARPSFALAAANRAAVARVCARLDGLPRAVELAAARVAAFSPAEIAERLDAFFDTPVDRGRGRPERQRTMRAAVAWSYALLSDDEQALFRRLAVFAGGFALGAAEAVQPGPATAVGLARLVDRSLVVADEGADGRTRYRVLEPLRQFAWERLAAAGEATEVRDRHPGYCVELAERTEPGLWADRGVEGARELEAEHDNLRAALAWALARDPGEALRLAASLGYFWRLRGHVLEGRRWLLGALERAPVDHPRRASALVGAAALSRDARDFDAGEAFGAEALSLARAARDDRLIGLALLQLVAARARLGDPLAVEPLAREMLERCRAAGFGWGTAAALNHLASLAQFRGDAAAARGLHEQALAESRRVGNRESECLTLASLGAQALALGDHRGAWALLERARRVWREHALAPWGVTPFLILQGDAALALGDPEAAEALLGEAAALARRYAGRPSRLVALHLLGVAAVRRGQPARGARLMAAARARAEEPGPPAVLREWLEGLGGGKPQGPLRRGGAEAGAARIRADQAEARAAMPPDAFTAAWAEGEAMSLDEALAYALEEGDG